MNADLFENFESRDAFRVCLTLLQNTTSCVLEDYPLTDEVTNHQFAHQFICKTKLNKLGSNLRGNLRFMKSLMSQKETDAAKIANHRKKLNDWHDYITQQHMFYYSRNLTQSWNYYGLALHYLIDAYYHIYTRLTAKSNKAVCFWCKTSLHKRWTMILSDVVTEHLPKVYLYLSLAQNAATENTPITEDLTNQYFQDVKFLVRESIK